MSEYVYCSDGTPLASACGEISLPREEIVRCRDCKYYSEYQDLCERLRPGMLVMDADDFCAWGERREQ